MILVSINNMHVLTAGSKYMLKSVYNLWFSIFHLWPFNLMTPTLYTLENSGLNLNFQKLRVNFSLKLQNRVLIWNFKYHMIYEKVSKIAIVSFWLDLNENFRQIFYSNFKLNWYFFWWCFWKIDSKTFNQGDFRE